LRCEVCGRKIRGKPNRVVIEVAKLTVCDGCAKLGTATWEPPKPIISPVKPRARSVTLGTSAKKPPQPPIDAGLELIEDFDAKIRQAREKLGISHEDLGKKLNLKVSLLRKIETGKMKPDTKVATVLEHALKVKLMVPPKEEKVPLIKLTKTASRELTLGDLIDLDKKGKERGDMTRRGQS